MRESHQPLDIRDPGVLAAIGSTANLVVWEMLRRIDRPVTADQLGKCAQLPRAEVQSALDAFEAIGLVGRKRGVRGGGGARGFGWVVTAPAIVVQYRVGDPHDQSLLARLDELFDSRRREEVAAHIKPEETRTARDYSWTSMHAGSFNAEEIRELWELLQGLARFFARSAERFKGAPLGTDHGCTHHVSVSVDPLLPGVLPLPNLQIIGQQFAAGVAERLAGGWMQSLTKREVGIARSLARGATTKRVADETGLSQHTVVEYTRRIYRKLGVRSRAQLAARIHSGG
ncbi:MAG: Bacterial regulatory protein luxR family [Planctomycetota bacterium]